MSEPQEVVIVDGQGTEHHFPPGFDPKKAAAIVSGHGPQAGPSTSPGQRMGPVAPSFGDRLGAALQQRSDALNTPEGISQAVNLLGAGAGAGDVLAAAKPGIRAAQSAYQNAGPVAQRTVKALVGGSLYQAGKKLGVPQPILEALAIGATPWILGGGGGGKMAPAEAPTPEAPAPTPTTPTYSGPRASSSAYVNVDSPMESGRSWHSGATDATTKAQAQALHVYDMDMDKQYRNATTAERAGFQAQPPLSFKDALVALLQNGGK